MVTVNMADTLKKDFRILFSQILGPTTLLFKLKKSINFMRGTAKLSGKIKRILNKFTKL